ncbi:MAG: NADH-quinone oxidoreductase subunit NuoF, partial [Planctomycetes bacterium]|nr:NADH-quinone oxidoreductase subunit NuoF [Planctomycetota bacterium]
MADKILLKNIETPNLADIQVYQRLGGYRALGKALRELKPDDVVKLVRDSGLRGRGGAYFPTGLKWGFLPKDDPRPRYLCVNCDESEPGTFKDRFLVVHDPHQVLEGVILSAYAIQAHTAYIYFRGEFVRAADVMRKAIGQARERGFLGRNILGSGFDLEVSVFLGAGAYICGEETGLLNSIEGKRGEPRPRPPFPALHGLYKCPTIINNVETLANVPHIVLHGPDWFKGFGTPKCPGTRLFAVSGHVKRPGVYELPMGTPLREIIFDHAGGMSNGHALKAVSPGGASAPILTPAEIDVHMDVESIQAIGSMLGSGGVMVMDDTVCIVRVACRLAEFFREESCGQCVPCREGTAWLMKVWRRI